MTAKTYYAWTFTTVMAVCAMVASSPEANALEAMRDEGADTEEPGSHIGVFFRLAISGGYGLYSGSGTAAPKPGLHALRDPKHQWLMLGGLLSLGGYVVENWALHADMAYHGIPKTKDEPTSQEYGHFSAGLGATHYFMPWNLYLTGSVRWARLLLRVREAEVCWFSSQFHTYDGIGGWLSFGKEWQGNRTGFGLGLELDYVRTLSEAPDFNQLGVMLVLTFTPN